MEIWESNDERLERVTSEYERLGQMYAYKNVAATQYHHQSGVEKKTRSENNAIIAFFRNISASHNAASRDGSTLDTHSKIKLEQARVKPELKKKKIEAKIDRKMYVYDRMHEAQREYYRLKSAGAPRREVQNQKLLWQELKKEWESTSKN